ncbi:hypothetical protein TUBRATIS_13880 [Tubulinosema ratisbonensis]|uniref:Uncharacterized protein n=1 Tax=Tubulinosema ratisbonensis TaxID=291195 RepID=A0A437ALR4_9MICR|nr:hypothetical protein TUBRATIS_13880 [Tubulinosema ratisbonensis]
MPNSRKKIKDSFDILDKQIDAFLNKYEEKNQTSTIFFILSMDSYLETLILTFILLKMCPIVEYYNFYLFYIILKSLVISSMYFLNRRFQTFIFFLVGLCTSLEECLKSLFICILMVLDFVYLKKISISIISNQKNQYFLSLLVLTVCFAGLLTLFKSVTTTYINVIYLEKEKSTYQKCDILYIKTTLGLFLYLITSTTILINMFDCSFTFYLTLASMMYLSFTLLIMPLLFKTKRFSPEYKISFLIGNFYKLQAVFLFNLLIFFEFCLFKVGGIEGYKFYLFDKKFYLEEKIWIEGYLSKH